MIQLFTEHFAYGEVARAGWKSALQRIRQVIHANPYDFLWRWAEDIVVKRFGDHKCDPPPGARKVTLPVIAIVKTLREESAIGTFRTAAALKQRYGIELGPATRGRVMAKNRERYGIGRPSPTPQDHRCTVGRQS
jgi:hypothetical protein